MAQTCDIPGLTDRLRAFGDDASAEAVAATGGLYRALHELEPYGGVRVIRDAAYGDHVRQRLDLFVPESDVPAAMPILVFAHGGGYVSGDKRLEERPYYDNVGLWAARRGLLGVTMNYRLAPAFAWPAGTDDVSDVVDWLHENAAAHGGDARRIILMGHSAGGAHIAQFLARNPARAPAAAVFVSGVYDIVRMERSANNAAYFGSDPARYEERSAIEGVARSSTPILVTCSEFDPHKFHVQASLLLARVLAVRGALPPAACLPANTHFSAVFHLNALDSPFSRLLETFLTTRVAA